MNAIEAKMETEENYMYPSTGEKLCEESQVHMSEVSLEQEHMDFSVRQQRKINQVVPEQHKENDKRQRERLSTWRYHCHVEKAVVTDKRSKLTAASKLLSAEEMQLLDEDIFNPLDIALIISKNSKITAGD